VSDDVRSMYDKEYLYAYDLDGADVTVCIERVKPGELVGTGGKKSKKPVVFFRGKTKGLALCITNTKTIGTMYGSFRAADWVGKWVTLYPTTTQFGGENRECIRIRPVIPKAKQQKDPPPPSDTNGDAT
jgi:hypothetical protein